MDDFIERLENARTDADWAATRGRHTNGEDQIMISREDCTAIGDFLTQVFGLVLLGKRDPDIADKIAILGGAFQGNSEDDDGEDEE